MKLHDLERILHGLQQDAANIDYDIKRCQEKLNGLLVEKFHNGAAIEELEKEIDRKRQGDDSE